MRPIRSPGKHGSPWNPRPARLFAALLTVAILGSAPRVAAEPVPPELLRQVRSTVLDPSRAVGVESIDLELGPGRFHMADGVVIPSRPVAGRTLELVFVGQGRFLLDPPDDIEAGQIELFAGQREIDTPVESAVLVLADADSVERLLGLPPPRDLRPSLVARARLVHTEWLAKTERRNSQIESALFKALVGDSAYQDFFAAWFRSHVLGDLVFQLDPEDEEQLTLANFVPVDLQGWERRRLARHIRLQQRKGRWLGVRVADLGAWDVWLSTAWSPAGSDLPGHSGFETEHYELDVKIETGDHELRGRAELDVVARTAGRRTLTLDLFPDLKIDSITDGEGRELFSFRNGNEVVVLLPQATNEGDRIALEVSYGGRILQWVGRKTYDLVSTGTWYPHCGTVDRATYDVTLHWPKKLDLLASGHRVDSGRDGRYDWERRRIDVPSIAFSFVMGDFEVDTRRVGHVEVRLAFNKNTRHSLTEEVRQQTMRAVARSLVYFERAFGPYPLDELTVVTLPRRYSQSYLGFVTLTDTILLSQDSLSQSGLTWLRDTTVAHELAHQWWGNLLGWHSYRDQWLSEAVANYSAGLYYAETEDSNSTFLTDMSAGWRDSLSNVTTTGRTVESLGPIVLGARLNSSVAANGYRAIVYRKGAVVLAMLARALGEERFLGVLRSLVAEAPDSVITTENFLEAVERVSGLNLDGFARQFIYGTGVPQVYYEYASEPNDDGGWTLRGEANLLSVPRYTVRVVRESEGRWDVRREAQGPSSDDPSTALMVPFRVLLDDSQERRSPPRSSRVRRASTGQLFLEGSKDKFEISSELKPLDLQLDPRDEIMAHFYAASRHPKRVSRYRAVDLALEGRTEEAERLYREALSHEPSALQTNEEPWLRLKRSDAETEDARIRLSLARLYLDQARLDDAEGELRAVDALLADDEMTFRMERDALWARIEIRNGDYGAAHKRLKKTLRLASPTRQRYGLRALLWQVRLGSEAAAMSEAYGLLSVAAHETGNDETLRWASGEATARGVDLDALDRLNP